MAQNYGLTYNRYMFQGKEFDMMHGLRWQENIISISIDFLL